MPSHYCFQQYGSHRDYSLFQLIHNKYGRSIDKCVKKLFKDLKQIPRIKDRRRFLHRCVDEAAGPYFISYITFMSSDHLLEQSALECELFTEQIIIFSKFWYVNSVQHSR